MGGSDGSHGGAMVAQHEGLMVAQHGGAMVAQHGGLMMVSQHANNGLNNRSIIV